jgi:hypothetical protein
MHRHIFRDDLLYSGDVAVDWLRAQILRYGLVVWFAANSVVGIAYAARDTSLLYFDARLYLMATRTWLEGGDPWSVQLAGNYFAAPPPSLLPLAPLSLLPLDVGVAIVAFACFAAAVATVRMLRLPWWWLFFPPLVQCLLSANVHALLIPLILAGAGWLATFLKAYAAPIIVILGRWRAALVALVSVAATAPLLPWPAYFSQFGSINAHLVEQTHYALPTVALMAVSPAALLAMAIVGRQRAAWLAVPPWWPSPQYYYGTRAMGARNALAAAPAALPIPGSGLLALLVCALVSLRRDGRPAWLRWPVVIGPSAR